MAGKFGKGTKNQRQPAAALDILGSHGYGSQVVPAVVCLQSVFPQLFTGGWWCFHGDGTSHGTTTQVKSGSPTTQTLPAINGLYCAPITRQVITVGNNYSTPLVATPQNSWSVGIFGNYPAPLASQTLIGQDDGSVNRFWNTQITTTGQISMVIAPPSTGTNGFNTAANAVVSGADYSVINTYRKVSSGANNVGTIYVNGAQSAQVSTLPAMAAGSFGMSIPGSSKNVWSAIFTETELQIADVIAIQNYLYPQPQGTRGEQLTFTRNSLASATCPDGTVTWLAPNRPAIAASGAVQQARANLLYWSEDFSQSVWQKLGGVNSPTATFGFADPFGGTNAAQLNFSNTNFPRFEQTFTANGGAYTLSAWVRSDVPISGTQIQLFDNTASASLAATSVTITTSWQRVSVTVATTTAGHSLSARPIFNPGSGVTGAYQVYGAQLEAFNTVGAYLKSTAVQGVETVPVPAQLQTQNPTNLQLWSEDLTQSSGWSAGTFTTAANQATAPNGSNTASSITPTNTGNNIHTNYNTILASGGAYTVSLWVKAVSGTTSCSLRIWDQTAGATLATLNFSNTTDWQRYSVSVASTTAGHILWFVFYPDTTAGTRSSYVWGAQLEQNSFATPYVKSTSTQGIYPAYMVSTGSGIKMRPAVTNLLTYSEQIGATAWLSGPVGSSLVTVTSDAINAPDGSKTADKIVGTTGTGQHYVTQSVTLSASTTYTFSVYLKAAEYTKALLQVATLGGGFPSDTFDLSAGTATTNNNGPKITPAANGFYRCSIAVNSGTGASTTRVSILLIAPGGATSFAGDATSGTYAWGAQLETGIVMSDYIRSEATSGVMAGETCTVPMPGARTNLANWSEDPSNVSWTKSTGLGIVLNADLAPNGSSTAIKLVEGSTTTSHRFSRVATTVVGQSLVCSVYAKAGTRNFLRMGPDAGSAAFPSAATAYFDLINGIITSVANPSETVATITPVGGGWYRCSVAHSSLAMNASGVTSYFQIVTANGIDSYAGDGASYIYVWGAQIEIGSTASHYIPTTSTAGTVTALNPAVDSRNLLTWSEAFDNAAWVKNATTVTANSTTAPDGSSNADTLSGGGSGVWTNQSIISNGSTYTFSVYAKSSFGTNTVSLRIFDFTSSTLLGNNDVAVGTSWTRISVTVSNVTSGHTIQARIFPDLTATNNPAYVWGAQLEVGSQATDYRQTTSVIGNYQPREGSVRFGVTPTWTGAPPATSYFLDGSSGGILRLGFNLSGAAGATANDGRFTPGVLTGFTAGTETSFRTKWSASANIFEMDNLTTMVNGTPQALFSGLSTSFDPTISIGNHNSANQPNATISDIVLVTDPSGVIK